MRAHMNPDSGPASWCATYVCRAQPVLFFCPWPSLCDGYPLLKAEGSLTFPVSWECRHVRHHCHPSLACQTHLALESASTRSVSRCARCVSSVCSSGQPGKERALAVMAPCVRRTRGYACTVTRAPSAWGSLHVGHRGDETAVAGNCTVSLMEP